MSGMSWRRVKPFLNSFAVICTVHDWEDNNVYFLNHKKKGTKSLVLVKQVRQEQPRGITPLD